MQRQAGGACPAPPKEPEALPPQQDPKFRAVTGDVKKQATKLKSHEPAKKKAAEAQDAAKPPPDEVESQAKAAKTDKMSTAKPGTFDKSAFIAAVRTAIAAKAPKNLDEADNFAKSDRTGVKTEVMGKVTQGKEGAAKDVKEKAAEPPDPSKAKPKDVKPAVEEKPGPAPAAPQAGKGMPSPAPAAEKDLRAGKCETDAQMKEADVTEDQLAKSNEPEFKGALDAKKEGEEHSATAPAKVEQTEKTVLADAKQGANADAKAAVTTMFGARTTAAGQVGAGKAVTQSKDEQERARISNEVKAIYDGTEKDVKAILDGLDKKVDDAFTVGEADAKRAFGQKHEAEMQAYKDRRYSGWTGKGRWLKDKFAGLPEEANQIYVRARDTVYLPKMDQVISRVADIVGGELTAAKQRIEKGRAEIAKYVAGLKPELQKYGIDAQKEFSSKFDELTNKVDEKQNEVVDSLATKYAEARDAVDAEIKKMQEDNKGLWDKVKDAVGGVIKTILQLKDMLLNVLGRAAGVVGKIIKAPIEFLGHLVSGVKNGLQSFLSNIADHLKKGVVGWLLGSLQSAGVEIPAKFDLKGILGMIASILGLTWGAIRARVVKRGVPERAMGAVEAAAPEVQTLQKEGVAGLWQKIVAKIGDIKEMVLTKLKEYLVPTILTAGIVWIVSLLNPASAFVKAIKAIIDIVRFIFERAAQLFEFVNSVLDAVVAIAGGAIGGAAKLIETALAKSIPVLIGFLAALLGIGGLANKIKSIFQSLSKPVMKVVDKVVDTIVKFGKKLWAKLTGKGKKGKKGKDGKEKELSSAKVRAGVTRDLNARLVNGIDPSKVRPAATAIFNKWKPKGLKGLDIVTHGPEAKQFDVYLTASARKKADTFTVKVEGGPDQDHFREEQPFQSKHVTAEETRAQVNVSWPSGVGEITVHRTATRRSADYFDHPDRPGELIQLRTMKNLLKRTGRAYKASNAGLHAERVALHNGTSQLPNPGDLKAANLKPTCWIQIHITRSPCSICAPAIVDAQRALIALGWEPKIRIAAAGLYRGDGGYQEGRRALAILRAAGVSISVLRMSEEEQKKTEAEKPKFAEHSGALARNVEAVERLKRMVEAKLGGS